MKKGGITNMLLLPFAHAFVRYMIAIQLEIKPTFTERMVWKWAWWRCGLIARRNESIMIAEVA
jgi:hypothetical protein